MVSDLDWSPPRRSLKSLVASVRDLAAVRSCASCRIETWAGDSGGRMAQPQESIQSSPPEFISSASFARRFVAVLAGILFAFAALSAEARMRGQRDQVESLRGLPLLFEPAPTRDAAAYDFLARASGQVVWLKSGEVLFRLDGVPGTTHSSRTRSVFRMRVVGAQNDRLPLALDLQPGVVNVLRGSDPEAWRTGIPTYARVRYPEILPGIDWEFYGTPDSLEHDFIIAPGFDPDAIELAFDGADHIVIDSEGGVQVHVKAGVVRLRPPFAYQERNGTNYSVAARYVRGHQGQIRFEVGQYDTSVPLVIDPVIEYSTYYGGGAAEIGYDIAVDSAGNVYIAGSTTSSNLPITTGTFDEVGRVGGFFDPGDAFVAKLAPDGSSLVWATYLSGRGLDRLFGIAIDGDRNVYVVGDTDSTDDLGTGGIDESYPLVGAAQGTFGGVSDLVVTKIDASGSSLVYSTYLGGNDADRGNTDQDRPAIDVDALGRAHVSVVTQSTDFHSSIGCTEIAPGPYVVRLSTDGSSFDTCVGLGGDDFVFARDIVVDSLGRALVVGFTADPNLNTTTGTFSISPLTGEDAFLMRVNATGTAIEAGTYFGGSGDDFANSVALGPLGNVYITGRSSGGGYPITIGAAPVGDAVATKIDGALSTVQYSLVLGYSEGLGIAVDSLGRATVVGTDNGDAGFTLLAANGQISHETFWGGSLFDQANGVALDPHGHAYVTGETRSTGFPGDTVLSSTPFQATRSGNIDAWIVKHLRDDPIALVPSMTWGYVLVAGALLVLGGRLSRVWDSSKA